MTRVAAGWALEVVRGQEPGRRYQVPAQGACNLGNDLGNRAGIDLSSQEGQSPRRMAGCQALLERVGEDLRLQDLASPGGTFVNKQRVPAGQWRPLIEGDLIQLGGVQLRLVRIQGSADAPPVVERNAVVARPFALPVGEGLICRSWDEVARASAQRWEALKDELASGRLAAFAHSVGRGDLAPDPTAGGTLDEQLDAWLGRIPTSKPGMPELDVHPLSLVIETAAAEGAALRRSITVSNTGYRLLKVRASVEPPENGWLSLSETEARNTLNVVEQTTIGLVVTVPALAVGGSRTARLRLKSNGGEASVEVSLKRGMRAVPGLEPESAGFETRGAWSAKSRLADQPLLARLVWWPQILGGGRLLLALGDALMAPAAAASPGWVGGVLLLAGLGMLAGMLASGGDSASPVDRAHGAFAGAFLGVVLATVAVAACRAIEPALGGNWLVKVMFWVLVGVALAALSGWLVPHRLAEEETE